ncbi:hypothetical protein LOK49_LG14G01758 [Camellia lanceoleosa]|uniref:Uncharacterized protein n=1 Tax=Camellia lanceoleosa TaxID=1840588 RepID=A0ACC0FAT2_9ERIC|nr:hypothetical protein LOK49_LG14G01758 [Camellia lanceoleosa]
MYESDSDDENRHGNDDQMVYRLEKKYFPNQCFDKAFLQPNELNSNSNSNVKGLVFFEDEEKGMGERYKGLGKDVKIDVSEKKVEELFKCLKKVPNKDVEVANSEPFVSTRSTGLPPKWDSPSGTVVLVNKPKGE